ncbi:MAG: preprotein translocase subunit SecE [Corynebacterium sp.]|nr:preprotein translocase subunit SecE [Corynebacterium sp.]
MSEERAPEQAGVRPAGKRQVAGSATATEAKSLVHDDEKLGGGPTQYIPEVVSEMRKVIWPTFGQMVSSVVVVVIFLILMTALVSVVDFAAGKGITALFG